MTEPVELPDLDEARTDRFARIIAVAAVLATVAAAAIGYLESLASEAGSRADVDAQRLAVQAFSELTRDREQAQVQYGLFVQRQGQLRNASSALEEIRFGDNASGRLAALELERDRYERLAEQTEETARRIAAGGGAPVLDPQGPDGPARDGLFPARFFSRSTLEGLRLSALRDAANEESTERGGQVASYVVMLAMLAVAVYLFGFSLTPHGRPSRKLFAGVAGALSAVAVVWGVFVSLFPPERAPDEAAAAYAEGRIANDLGDYDEAVRLLSRAIELRPTFARAYEQRAQAEFSRGSPQIGGLSSLSSPESLEKAVADQRRARELGSTDIRLLGNLGFNTLLLGLAERSQQRLDEAVALAREAEASNPRNPVYALNRAVAHLAAGDEEARDVYRDAVAKVLRQDDGFAEQAYVSGALTDLELTAAALGGETAEQADEIKAFLVGSVAAGRVLDAPAGPERRLEDVDVIMTPSTALADLPSGELDTGADEVSLQWFQRQGDLGWAALPEISGPVEDFEWTTDSTDGSTFVRRAYLAATAPPTCLPTTDYRVEVYVNGRLAATGASDPEDSLGDLTASVDPDIGYAVCHPPGWRPVANPLPGLVNGHANAGSTRGIFVVRVAAGGSVGAGTPTGRALRKFERVLTLLFPDEAPRRGASEQGAFLGLEGAQIRRYTFNGGGGVIRAGFGFDVNGALLAAIVFGEPEYMGTDEAYEVLNSVAER